MKRLLLIGIVLCALCLSHTIAIAQGVHNGHQWVDLGLPSGLKWATCNVGATNPEDCGDYFAWGEVSTKSSYTKDNCLTSGKRWKEISGDPHHDAATVNWGGGWRMPTLDEIHELCEYCNFDMKVLNGVLGYAVYSKENENCFFLPASGRIEGASKKCKDEVFFWLSTLYSKELGRFLNDPLCANYGKYSTGVGGMMYRHVGLPIRPVLDASYTSGSESDDHYSPFPPQRVLQIGDRTFYFDDEDLSDIIIIKDDNEYDIDIIENYTEDENDGVVKEEPIPFQLVEEKPLFQSGDANKFSKWVNERLVYPELAKENGIQGRVTLKFTVDKDGSLIDIRVIRGVHPDLNNEALRVVSQSPKWEPGKQRGRAVPVEYTFPVIFQLK